MPSGYKAVILRPKTGLFFGASLHIILLSVNRPNLYYKKEMKEEDMEIINFPRWPDEQEGEQKILKIYLSLGDNLTNKETF